MTRTLIEQVIDACTYYANLASELGLSPTQTEQFLALVETAVREGRLVVNPR